MSALASFLMSVTSASDAIRTGAGQACATSCNTSSINLVFRNLANTLTFIVGSVSVIMIIIGGLRYVLSSGDSKATVEAKNTILYAIIGVVVAIVAYAVISFVNGSIGMSETISI